MTSGSKAREEREKAREQARRIASRNGGGGDPKKKALYIKIGVVVALLAVVGLVFGVVIAGSKKTDPNLETSTAPPANVSANGAVVYKSETPKENAPTVAVYVDYQCPACKQFEEGNDANLKEMAKSGDIILEQHAISILDHTTSTNYASRSGNAFACVVNTAPDKAEAFSKKLFEIQPPEGGAGISNVKLNDAAKETGVDNVEECITGGGFRGWIKAQTDTIIEKGLTATPGIFINGTQWDRKGSVYDAIEAAKTAPVVAETASASPSATPAP